MKIKVNYVLPLMVISHIAIWYIVFFFLKRDDIFGLYTNFFDFIIDNQGEFYSTLMMRLISFNISLACRFKYAEYLFSGLDKIYVIHKYTGYLVLLLVILHSNLITSTRFDYTGFFSFSKEIANPLMYALIASILISGLPHIPYVKKILNIPYNIWKYTHYLMWVIFLVGIYHSVGVQSFTFSNPFLSVYMYVVYAIGIYCLFYKLFIYKLFKTEYKYKISNIKKFEEAKTTELELSPIDESIKWVAGQFAFFKFKQADLEESHPFTMSNSYNEKGVVRLSVKSLGDWTQDLFEKINQDVDVIVEGPYGKFNSKKSKNNLEIWIAGGIGITPFISMLEDYKKENNLNKKIIFVWSVKSESEAIYKEEIEKDLPENIKFILHDTSKMGFFKFESLLSLINDKNNTSVYICGPAPMREAIINDAKKENFSDFHFEEFNFR
ncbi:MAG: hypothetical protein QG630_107 [Patescibacteria group bacterium]|nr:hypothetical protein [Patescibacteria group bacterium]